MDYLGWVETGHNGRMGMFKWECRFEAADDDDVPDAQHNDAKDRGNLTAGGL